MVYTMKDIKIAVLVCVLGIFLNSQAGCGEVDMHKGLVAHWEFEEIKDDLVKDSSENKNHAVAKGGVKLVPGKSGKAIELDGKTGYINAGQVKGVDFGKGNFTISFWIKTETQKDGQLFIKGAEWDADPGD